MTEFISESTEELQR